nr:uncharacterized protein LOC129163732 [Nothobranchius furzeri]
MYTYFVFTVFYYLFGRTERLPTRGGRERLQSPEQETEILNMVQENNVITLRQIQRKMVENNDTFHWTMCRYHLRMKQVYRVPFERNSERVKELRYNYVQRVLELEAAAVEHQLIFIDEVGFNLTKRRKRGRNIIGQCAIVEVPGQRGGNITMCAALGYHGIIHHHATLGPYNSAHLITFLDTLHNTLIPPDQVDGPEEPVYKLLPAAPSLLDFGTACYFRDLDLGLSMKHPGLQPK